MQEFDSSMLGSHDFCNNFFFLGKVTEGFNLRRANYIRLHVPREFKAVHLPDEEII